MPFREKDERRIAIATVAVERQLQNPHQERGRWHGGKFRLIGFMLAEDHPGKGIPFQIWVAIWNPATNGWGYDKSIKHWAIDWRHDVPYPTKCATGLGCWRPSNAYGKIMEVVPLDCSSPGCEG